MYNRFMSVVRIRQGKYKGWTYKQRDWYLKMIEYEDGTKAALEVYDCKDKNSAKVISSQNLTKLNVDFNDILKAEGLTEKFLVKKTKEGLLNAPKYSDRHKYLETSLRLAGHGKESAQVNVQVNNVQNSFQVPHNPDE